MANRLRQYGQVVLRFLIDTNGVPQNIVVTKSSGYASLDEAALDNLKKHRFHPATENGRATTAWATLPYNFDPPK